MLNPDRYYPVDREALTKQLVEVVSKLVALASQYRDAKVAQRKTYQEAFESYSMPSREPSVAARERAANYASFAEWAALQDVKCDTIELEHERDLILVLLGV